MKIDTLLSARAHCRARHTGLWAMEATTLRQEVSVVNLGLSEARGPYKLLARERQLISKLRVEGLDENEREQLAQLQANTKTKARKIGGDHDTVAGPIRQRDARRKPFLLDLESGIAIIEMSGVMGKGESKFFDVNTIEVRRAVRMAVEDADVRGILMMVDSPGGTVSGTAELGDDVRVAAAAKPLRVHADDLMASAALWATASADKITAGRTTEVGSVGTLLVIEDFSAAMEASGVAVHVISTGAMKGAGVEGAEVTPEQLAMFQARVEDINAHFLAQITEGRGLRGDRLAAVSDGRVFIASEAKDLGLIDGVMSSDEALQSFRKSLQAKSRKKRQKAQLAALDIDLGLS